MATVTVPAEFFRGELRVYGNWREAFARELLQNAVDAAPTRIDVAFTTVDGHGRVTFSDDGCGMSRVVLEEVFFALGKTTKTGADSIGGFGRARIIICFAQHRYQIRTGHLLVDGYGGEYTISESADYYAGTQFIIDVLDENTERIAYAFRSLLRTCTLGVPVILDGVDAPRRAMPARAARVMRDGDANAWGRVYVTGGLGALQVRVHGLTMFTRWLLSDDDIVLELEPARSRELLSASRDQLHDPFNQELDKFISDLTRNRRGALKAPDRPLDLRVGGGGFLATDAAVLAEPEPAIGTGEHGQLELSLPAPAAGTWVPVTAANEAAYAHQEARRKADGTHRRFAELPSHTLGFDVYLLADASDARVRKLARAWDPTGWDENNGLRRRALLTAWKSCVAYAMNLLVGVHPELGRVLWTVGWVFDTDVRGLHRSSGGGHILALNPVDGNDVTRYKITSRVDRQLMLSIALHEVAHVAVDGHDEKFAGVLTSLIGAVDPAAAERAMRTAT